MLWTANAHFKFYYLKSFKLSIIIIQIPENQIEIKKIIKLLKH